MLLQGKWKEAVELLLRPSAGARDEVVQAWKMYSEGDVDGALRTMPRNMVVEPAILQARRRGGAQGGAGCRRLHASHCLRRSPGKPVETRPRPARSRMQGLKQHGRSNFVHALTRIPRNLRTMYIHAYQSYLWNSAASHRVETFGTERAVAGDLVLPRQAAAAATPPTAVRSAPASQDGGDGDDAPAQAGEEEEEEEEGQALGAEVHVVTADEAAAGAYGMEDVVLPLPGSQVEYPKHSTADVYEQLAQRDGVSLRVSPHGVQDFSITALAGAYRHVLTRPADVEVRSGMRSAARSCSLV